MEDFIRAWTSIVPFIKHFLDCMAGRVNFMTLIGKILTSRVISLTPIFAKILTSVPYNCWPLLMRKSVIALGKHQSREIIGVPNFMFYATYATRKLWNHIINNIDQTLLGKHQSRIMIGVPKFTLSPGSCEIMFHNLHNVGSRSLPNPYKITGGASTDKF